MLWANLRVENDTLLTGYRITNGWSRVNYTYFAISFSQPITHYGYTDREKVNYPGGFRRFNTAENFPEIGGRKVVSYFEFKEGSAPLEIKVALSAVGTDGFASVVQHYQTGCQHGSCEIDARPLQPKCASPATGLVAYG